MPDFFKLIKHPLKFRLFLLTKLPSAYFSGVRVKEADEYKCVVTVPFRWFTQNPFRSTYFACLSMAAEMSTGTLALSHIYQRKPAVSMLVLNVTGNFIKKATGMTSFTCNDGAAIRQCIEDSIASGEGKSITVSSIGINKDGEIVAAFEITWSFKAKKK